MIQRVRARAVAVMWVWLAGCATTPPPALTAQGTPMVAFADSIGFDVEAHADPDLMANAVKVVPYRTTLGDRLTGVDPDGHSARQVALVENVFGQWCAANGGVLSRDAAVARSFDTAAREYYEQRQEKRARRAQRPISSRVCASTSGQAVGAYLNLGDADLAFYDPPGLAAFIDRFESAARTRVAREQEATALRAAEARRAQAEEDGTIAASGVGGASLAETLDIMARARQDDLSALMTTLGHKAPCILVVRSEELSLNNVRLSLRDKETDMVVNAITQEIGTRVTHILDVMDGARHASIEFSSVRNAELTASGIDHLAQLCGRRP